MVALITNQGNNFYNQDIFKYDSLNYRSPAEVALAKAIDLYNDNPDNTFKIHYFPNNILVTPFKNNKGHRDKIEADFILFVDNLGVSVLEVDGEQHANRQVQQRDVYKEKIWKSMGFRVIERFSASDCLDDANHVLNCLLTRMEAVYSQCDKSTQEGWESQYKWNVWCRFYQRLLALEVEKRVNILQSCIPLDFDGYTFKFGVLSSKSYNIPKLNELLNLILESNIYEIGFGFSFSSDFLSFDDFHRLKSYLTDEVMNHVEKIEKQKLENGQSLYSFSDRSYTIVYDYWHFMVYSEDRYLGDIDIPDNLINQLAKSRQSIREFAKKHLPFD